jgi:SAM-dependent methyltransferase
VSSAPAPEHYSYAHYADPATARTFDDLRFGGPIGSLIAQDQARILVNALDTARHADTTHPSHATPPSHATHPTTSVLDVGTGTGRAALLLARNGARVTGVDASDAMLTEARRRAAVEGIQVTFQKGDAHSLEFPDRSFDVVISLRVLMHTPDWRGCVAELCRVADQAVVIDYPSAFSVAVVESAGRRAAQTLGVSTESYRVFRPRTVTNALVRHGFRVRSVHRQFVLPIAMHKSIGSQPFTTSIEGAFSRVGLLRLLGSPITVVAERCASS